MSGVVLRRSARFVHTASTFAPASGPGATAAPTQVHDEDLSDPREIPLMDARPAKRARVERNTRAILISNTQNHKAKDRAVPSKAPRKPAHHKAETVEPVPSDFSSRAKSQWKIGPHVSAAGGVENTIINAAKVGALDIFIQIPYEGIWIFTVPYSASRKLPRQFGQSRQYLRGMHLNDSKGALSSKKDRHENIGLGELGLAAFAHVLADPRTRYLPLILETPAFDTPGAGGGLGATGGMDVWRKEVEVLNRLATTPGNEKTHEAARQEIAAVVKVAAAARDAKGKKRAVGEKSRSKRKRRTNEDDEAGCGSCDDGGDVED
ncbi:predicted protein [Postia placenta Mad-698-R]|nr:predicted protein [Postia placenta Mad-698-R]